MLQETPSGVRASAVARRAERSVTRSIRFSVSELERLRRAARDAGMSVSAFVRHAAASRLDGRSTGEGALDSGRAELLEHAHLLICAVFALRRDELIREGREAEAAAIPAHGRRVQAEIPERASRDSGASGASAGG